MGSSYILYLDLGASLTKGFFRCETGSVEPILMGSEVSGPLSRSHLDTIKSFSTSSRPELCAWLGRGSELRAVGQFAQNFGGESWVDERKELRAVDKILAAIGVIKERSLTISGQGFSPAAPISVQLGVLLPFSEFEDRHRISKELRSLKEFTFRGCPIKLEFKEISFRPEGFGLCLDAIKALRDRGVNPDHCKQLIVMAGHRNTSVLVFEGDSFQSGKSTSNGPGFVEALAKGLQSRSFQKTDYPKLMSALVGGKSKVVLRGDKKLTDISDSVKVGLDSYWSLLESFLTANITGYLDDSTTIVISGGAAQIVRPQLELYLQGFGLEPIRYQVGYQLSTSDLQKLESSTLPPASSTYCQLDDKLAELLRHLVAEPQLELASMAARMSDSYSALNQMLSTMAVSLSKKRLVA